MTVDTTEIYEAVPGTEEIEIPTIQSTESTESSTQEVETPTETTALVNDSTAQAVESPSQMDSIANDVHIIMVLMLLSFCWSCMKSWRIHSLKGVRK